MKRKLTIVILVVAVLSCLATLVACQHKCTFGEWQTVKEATCTEQGLKERYCTDSSCNKKEEEKIPVNENNHNLQPVDGVDSTCTTEGTVAHQHCTLCGKNFDGNKNEITEVTIPTDSTKHNLQPVSKVDATCESDGTVEHNHCTLCGKNFDTDGNELTTVAIPKGHKFETVNAVSNDHTEGMQAYRTCKACNKNFALTEDVEVNLADLIVAANHSDYDKDTLYCGTCDKYVIIDSEQLALFRDNVNTSDKYSGKTVVLDADIDLDNQEWTPINGFLGTFDGQGHTISNLKITGQNNIGLFGDMWQCEATIRNFTVDGAIITGTEKVSVIVGNTASMQISNITVKNAQINANHWAGAIAGFSYSNITNCSVDGLEIICVPNASGSSYDNGDKVGGIVGYNVANSVTDCTVKNAVLKGYRDIGGIVGALQCADGQVASATGNSVSNITVKVDQVTNHYGPAAMNVGAIVGRAMNEGSIVTNIENNQEEDVKYEYTVNSASAQMALDSFKNNSTIKLVADTYDKLYIRQSKYVSVDTLTSSIPWYIREISNVCIVGESGTVVNGLELVVGHMYSGNNTVYNPVTEKNQDYYSEFVIKDLVFSSIKFTEYCEFNGWYHNLLSCDGLTMSKCEFDMKDSTKSSDKMEAETGGIAAAHFGSGEDARIWKNLVFEQCVFKNAFQGIYTTNSEGINVKDCKFENIKHNAIALQSVKSNGKVGTVGGTIVIENNEFINGQDRAIRFNDIGADAVITVKNNTLTTFCDKDGEILKSTSTAVGSTFVFEGNSYGGTLLENKNIEGNGDAVIITNK